MHGFTIPRDGIYLYLEGENRPYLGPLALEHVRELFERRQIKHSTFMWFEGLTNWIAVGDIPEFDRRQSKYVPPQNPEKTGDGDYLVFHDNRVEEVTEKELKALIENRIIRRSDLVFEEFTKQWGRADQHDKIKFYFYNPQLPETAVLNSLPAQDKPANATPNAAQTTFGEKISSAPKLVHSEVKNESPSSHSQRRAQSEPSGFTLDPLMGVVGKVAFASMGALAVLLVVLVSSHKGKEDNSLYVGFEDIQSQISLAGSKESLLDEWNELEMPPIVRDYFGRNYRQRILIKWLQPLNESQKEDFLENMGELMAKVQKDRPKKMSKALKEYYKLKVAKLSSGDLVAEVNRVQSFMTSLLALFAIGLIGFFSLIAVLLRLHQETKQLRAQAEEKSDHLKAA